MAHQVLDVLIVGAGPTGLTLALELEAQGIPFRIVDKADVRPTTSRSLVVHPRTLELLNRHGDAHQLKQPGCTVKGATWFISPTSHPNFDFDGLDIIDTEFPNTMCVSQIETERFLETNLTRVSGGKPRVEWSTTVESVEQDGEGVTATLSRSSGKESGEGSTRETLRCRYVVGCDGTHSVVRRAAKHIEYPGGTYEHEFILCDAVVSDTTLPRDRVLVILSKVFTLVFPLDGGKSFRITTARVPNPNTKGGSLLPTLAEFQALLDSVVDTSLPPGTKAGTLHDPTWLARFKIHHRCASNYRDGRLLIAGDAAHIHSPIGGQGLNTSIQDAVNLGWKLAAVLQSHGDGGGGDSSESPLLNTYNEERRPVGLALLASTDRLFRFATMQNKLAVWLRNLLLSWILPLVLGNKARRQKLFRVLAELTINYRGSSIVGTGKGFEGPIRGGDRVSSGKLVRITTGGEGGANGNGAHSTAENTTTLQRLCGATRHHLVLFAGPDNNDFKDEFALDSDLCQAAACVKAARADLPVSTIFAGDRAVPPMLARTAYRDPGGEIHAHYSFQKKPGYVLVRPDSYVAHIGYLSHLDELLAFFRKV